MSDDRYGVTEEGAEYVGMHYFWFVTVPAVMVMLGACWMCNGCGKKEDGEYRPSLEYRQSEVCEKWVEEEMQKLVNPRAKVTVFNVVKRGNTKSSTFLYAQVLFGDSTNKNSGDLQTAWFCLLKRKSTDKKLLVFEKLYDAEVKKWKKVDRKFKRPASK